MYNRIFGQKEKLNDIIKTLIINDKPELRIELNNNIALYMLELKSNDSSYFVIAKIDY